MKKCWVILLALAVGACSSKKDKFSDLFARGKSLGQVNKRLEEASGLVESFAHPKHFWTLNDSGHPAEVFLIDDKAQIQLVCKIKGVENRDFEDITIGPGPIEGKEYIYVGDIGDNLEKFPLKFIYRFPEPISLDSMEITISDFDTLTVQLDGKNRDTEALFVDPVKHDLYMVSKREDSVRLFQVTYPFTKDTMVAKQVAILPFHKIVAAHITHSGQEFLMKDYDRVYYWQNRKGLAISEWLQSKPEILNYDRERQGEAICWANDGSGYYTLSEAVRGEMGRLLYYKRK
jgi:hypothetical protein